MKKRKKTKIRRLKTNEVLFVAEMQSKIDFYERFIHEISVMCLTKKVQLILEGKYSDNEVGEIYKFVRQKIEDDKKPKFRIGDTIKYKYPNSNEEWNQGKIVRIDCDNYYFEDDSFVKIEFQDNWALVD